MEDGTEVVQAWRILFSSAVLLAFLYLIETEKRVLFLYMYWPPVTLMGNDFPQT